MGHLASTDASGKLIINTRGASARKRTATGGLPCCLLLPCC